MPVCVPVCVGCSPVLEQQGPEDVGAVLCFDLVRDDHLLHHLVSDAREGLLVQIKEHGAYGGHEEEEEEEEEATSH